MHRLGKATQQSRRMHPIHMTKTVMMEAEELASMVALGLASLV